MKVQSHTVEHAASCVCRPILKFSPGDAVGLNVPTFQSAKDGRQLHDRFRDADVLGGRRDNDGL
jgi:hypothetical protein